MREHVTSRGNHVPAPHAFCSNTDDLLDLEVEYFLEREAESNFSLHFASLNYKWGRTA